MLRLFSQELEVWEIFPKHNCLIIVVHGHWKKGLNQQISPFTLETWFYTVLSCWIFHLTVTNSTIFGKTISAHSNVIFFIFAKPGSYFCQGKILLEKIKSLRSTKIPVTVYQSHILQLYRKYIDQSEIREVLCVGLGLLQKQKESEFIKWPFRITTLSTWKFFQLASLGWNLTSLIRD